MNYDEVQKAFTRSANDYESFLEKAAKTNDLDVENVREIIANIIN